jgi:hypothetical protein
MTSKQKIPGVFFELLSYRERRSARSIAAVTDHPGRNKALLPGESNHMRFAEGFDSIEGDQTFGRLLNIQNVQR